MGKLQIVQPKDQAEAYAIQPFQEAGTAREWQEMSAPLFSVSPIHSGPTDAGFSVKTWFVGPFVFCRIETAGGAIKRTQRHVLASGRFLALVRVQQGRVFGHAEGVPFDVQPGMIAAHDYSRAFEAVQSSSTVDTVLVPYRASGGDIARRLPVRVLDAASRLFAEISEGLDLTFDLLQGGAQTISRGALRTFSKMTASILADELACGTTRVGVRRAQRHAIDIYIEQNLESPDLSTASILQTFGVSRASLYRLFEPEGGVRSYISDRRLFRALFEIAKHPDRRGQIQYAAIRWGFSSGTQFNRSVRRAFGVTPGTMFRDALEGRRSEPFRSDVSAFLRQRALIRARS